jgi:hypothetical protein
MRTAQKTPIGRKMEHSGSIKAHLYPATHILIASIKELLYATIHHITL